MVGGQRWIFLNLTPLRRLFVALATLAAVIVYTAGTDVTSNVRVDRRNHRGAVADCRVALCLSGAIRSFVHPVVHRSIRQNLIEAIEADGCEVDVFAYATRKDKVGSHKTGNREFNPVASDIKTALAVLAPKRLVWHQEQAGIIPNSCPIARSTPPLNDSIRGGDGGGNVVWNSSTWQMFRPDASNSLYWQMYKSLAAYRLAQEQENRAGDSFAYDWIIRGRFDVAWVRPLPPLRSFSRESVWVGRNYWPMSDQFALVPRAFADRYFSAISAFFACDGQSWPPPVSWWQPGCRGGFEETVLFRHLHASDVPYRTYFMFEYIITRGALGGICHHGEVTFGEACTLLGLAGALRSPTTSQDCTDILAEWANLRCRALLPATGMDDARRNDILLSSDPRAWERLVKNTSSHVTSRVAAVGGSIEGVVPIARDRSDEGFHFTNRDGVLQGTAVPTASAVDRIISKLVVLRDAVLVRQHTPPEENGSIFDNFEARNSSRSSRWEGWRTPPPWAAFSHDACPLAEPQFPGLSPHVITYFTMGKHLISELTQALQCFITRLVAGTQESESDSEWILCEQIRPLEIVMIDVALHTEELGICTADASLKLSAMEHVLRYFHEPAVYCKGYGNMDEAQNVVLSLRLALGSCSMHEGAALGAWALPGAARGTTSGGRGQEVRKGNNTRCSEHGAFGLDEGLITGGSIFRGDSCGVS